MNKLVLVIGIAMIAVCMVLTAGCTSGSNPVSTQVPTAASSPAPVSGGVTDPIVVDNTGLNDFLAIVDAVNVNPNVKVTAYYSTMTPSGKGTGDGTILYSTLFVYNPSSVPAGFNPKTKEDVISAGIPYKSTRITIYPNNEMDTSAELPSASIQGTLDVTKPYNYGVIIDNLGKTL